MKKLKIVQIELTNRCNATCSYCPQPTMKRKKIDMTNEIFNRTLEILDRTDYWRNFDRDIVELHHFGESLLLGDRLFYFLDRMVEENIPWSLSTNGMLLNNTEFNIKLLSYNGVLEISIENINKKVTLEQKYDIVNDFLALHKKLNSKLTILLITFGNVDFSKITGCAGISNYKIHSWGETGKDGVPYCKFLSDNYFSVHSDGTIVGCCFDAEYETNYGTVFEPTYEKNKIWRKCNTCIG